MELSYTTPLITKLLLCMLLTDYIWADLNRAQLRWAQNSSSNIKMGHKKLLVIACIFAERIWNRWIPQHYVYDVVTWTAIRKIYIEKNFLESQEKYTHSSKFGSRRESSVFHLDSSGTMAVIEEESSVQEEFKSQPRSTAAAAPSGYSSDGYETASDTELNDAVSEPEIQSHSNGSDDQNNVSGIKNGGDEVSREVKEEEQQEMTEGMDTKAIEVMR